MNKLRIVMNFAQDKKKSKRYRTISLPSYQFIYPNINYLKKSLTKKN